MTTENTAAHAKAIAWPGKLTFILLCLTVALPMISAYWIYQNGTAIPKGTINKGHLITPATQLNSLDFYSLEGQASNWLNSRNWRMVTVIDGNCDAVCKQNLYQSRQVHVRLAKEADRIQRLLVIVSNTPDAALLPEIAANDSGLTIVSVANQAWSAAFNRSDVANFNNSLMIVDQDGFAMMAYSPDHSGSDVLDDLKRLLKYSYE